MKNYVKKNSSNLSNIHELIGMPATGKSTMVIEMKKKDKALVDVNKKIPNSKFLRQVFKVHCILLQFILSPCMFLKDVKLIYRTKQKSFKDFVTVLSNWFLIIYLYNSHKKNKFEKKVFDQGILQAVWSIALTSTAEINMLKLLENKVLPDSIYFLDEEDEVLIQRAKKRNIPMRIDYSDVNQIKNGRILLGQLVETLNDLGYEPQIKS